MEWKRKGIKMKDTNIDVEEAVKNGGYISKLYLNNGKEVDIKENDIVLFVGPNNAGKSQALKDIYEICKVEKPTVVVNDIDLVKYDGDIEELLESISIVDDSGGSKNYSGFGYSIATYSIADYEKN